MIKCELIWIEPASQKEQRKRVGEATKVAAALPPDVR
jgi:hypothetical protein